MRHWQAWTVGIGIAMTGVTGFAQGYPERPVRIVVAYPAGGPADIAARLVAEQVSRQWPQNVIIDNRPGAGGLIGTELVANATPDGYTLLLSGNNIAIAQALAAEPATIPSRASRTWRRSPRCRAAYS